MQFLVIAIPITLTNLTKILTKYNKDKLTPIPFKATQVNLDKHKTYFSQLLIDGKGQKLTLVQGQ